MASDIRWWVAPPASDESLDSLLLRAAALYEVEPLGAWRQLHEADDCPVSDIDDPSPASLQLLAHALGTCATELHRHRIEDSPVQLAPAARRSYCPECRRCEADAGQPATRRRAWTRVLRTSCAEHGVPLVVDHHDLRCVWRRGEFSPLELSESDRAILALIDSFAITLEAALFEGLPWPPRWRGSATQARAWLLGASFNTQHEPAPLTIANVCPSTALSLVVHGPRHLAAPARRADWEAFRGIVDPAVRRAALWVVAWWCVPDLPDGLCPGFIPAPTAD